MQYSLLKMIKNWSKKLEHGEKVGLIFTDLSKAFHSVYHSLLLAKLKAYGFFDQVLSLLQIYLYNRFQRSIINSSFSNWNKMIAGVPQGYIIDPQFCNIFLNYIFQLKNFTYGSISMTGTCINQKKYKENQK